MISCPTASVGGLDGINCLQANIWQRGVVLPPGHRSRWWGLRPGGNGTTSPLLACASRTFWFSRVSWLTARTRAGMRHGAPRAGTLTGPRWVPSFAPSAITTRRNSMISHPTASAVILNDGHVLLLESAKGIGFIYPGGHVDNEDPATAAAREVREETLPFAIIDGKVTDRKIGAHRHVDSVYLYELFRLSIRPLLRRDCLGHGRALAVQGCP